MDEVVWKLQQIAAALTEQSTKLARIAGRLMHPAGRNGHRVACYTEDGKLECVCGAWGDDQIPMHAEVWR